MLIDLSGKSVVVTGSTRGIGFAVAKGLTELARRWSSMAASVEEVANLVVYVASPQASATTGAALRVDGGVVDAIV